MELFDTEPLLADVTGLPVFVVDSVIRRDLGSGVISIINCRKMGGIVVPQCEIIIAAHHLGPIAQGASDFAQEIQRKLQMAHMTELIGAKHH